MRSDDCFCVLGVICDLTMPDKWDGSRHDGNLMAPGIIVHIETGLTEREVTELMDLNDVKKLTFSEIADHLEKQCVSNS